MFRSFAVVLLALTACYRSSADADHCNLSCNADSPCPNGLTCNGTVCAIEGKACNPFDAPPIDPDATSMCAGSGLLGQICFDSVPTPSAIDPTDGIDTDTDPRCAVTANNDPLLCVLVVDEFSTQLRATGNKPLVLWSSNTLTMNGAIDVASYSGTPTGAGSGLCPVVIGIDGQKGTGVSGGGAGGSFGTPGGNGGPSGGAAMGGTAIPPAVKPSTLRGGCPGGVGGGPSTHGPAPGGGAVYLMAAARIIVGGTINASGAGGEFNGTDDAGNGGGSGGLIGFDAPNIQILDTAIVLALGGGGSSGGENTKNAGAPGKEPGLTNPYFAGFAGGPGNCDNGTSRGGRGSVGASGAAGVDGGAGASQLGCNGGGGGGGSGFTLTFGELTTANAVLRPEIQ